MPIDYRKLPQNVVDVYGPVIDFPEPVTLNDIDRYVGDGSRPRAPYQATVKRIRLALHRDGNYINEKPFYLSLVESDGSPYLERLDVRLSLRQFFDPLTALYVSEEETSRWRGTKPKKCPRKFWRLHR
jgi:hypothetical protein